MRKNSLFLFSIFLLTAIVVIGGCTTGEPVKLPPSSQIASKPTQQIAPECVNECNPGQKECIYNCTPYGDGARHCQQAPDGCYYWTYTCCIEGYHCVDGDCVNCTDTCDDLGYECGEWEICGELTDCGSCPPNQICINGECDYEWNCNDTDGGYQPYEFGICTDDIGSYSDYCMPNNQAVFEYWCNASTHSDCAHEIISCPSSYVCSAGACVQNQSNQTYCYDSDGGIILNVTGTVSGELYGQPYSLTDFCTGNHSLQEYYCTGDFWAGNIFSCSGNYSFCSDGRCYD